jgi:hypothetical protein
VDALVDLLTHGSGVGQTAAAGLIEAAVTRHTVANCAQAVGPLVMALRKGTQQAQREAAAAALAAMAAAAESASAHEAASDWAGAYLVPGGTPEERHLAEARHLADAAVGRVRAVVCELPGGGRGEEERAAMLSEAVEHVHLLAASITSIVRSILTENSQKDIRHTASAVRCLKAYLEMTVDDLRDEADAAHLSRGGKEWTLYLEGGREGAGEGGEGGKGGKDPPPNLLGEAVRGLAHIVAAITTDAAALDAVNLVRAFVDADSVQQVRDMAQALLEFPALPANPFTTPGMRTPAGGGDRAPGIDADRGFHLSALLEQLVLDLTTRGAEFLALHDPSRPPSCPLEEVTARQEADVDSGTTDLDLDVSQLMRASAVPDRYLTRVEVLADYVLHGDKCQQQRWRRALARLAPITHVTIMRFGTMEAVVRLITAAATPALIHLLHQKDLLLQADHHHNQDQKDATRGHVARICLLLAEVAEGSADIVGQVVLRVVPALVALLESPATTTASSTTTTTTTATTTSSGAEIETVLRRRRVEEAVKEQATLSLWQLCLVDDAIKLAAAAEGAVGLLMEVVRSGSEAAVGNAAAALGVIVPFLVAEHKLGLHLTPSSARDLVKVLTMTSATRAVRLATLKVVSLVHALADNKHAFVRGGAAMALAEVAMGYDADDAMRAVAADVLVSLAHFPGTVSDWSAKAEASLAWAADAILQSPPEEGRRGVKLLGDDAPLGTLGCLAALLVYDLYQNSVRCHLQPEVIAVHEVMALHEEDKEDFARQVAWVAPEDVHDPTVEANKHVAGPNLSKEAGERSSQRVGAEVFRLRQVAVQALGPHLVAQLASHSVDTKSANAKSGDAKSADAKSVDVKSAVQSASPLGGKKRRLLWEAMLSLATPSLVAVLRFDSGRLLAPLALALGPLAAPAVAVVLREAAAAKDAALVLESSLALRSAAPEGDTAAALVIGSLANVVALLRSSKAAARRDAATAVTVLCALSDNIKVGVGNLEGCSWLAAGLLKGGGEGAEAAAARALAAVLDVEDPLLLDLNTHLGPDLVHKLIGMVGGGGKVESEVLDAAGDAAVSDSAEASLALICQLARRPHHCHSVINSQLLVTLIARLRNNNDNMPEEEISSRLTESGRARVVAALCTVTKTVIRQFMSGTPPRGAPPVANIPSALKGLAQLLHTLTDASKNSASKNGAAGGSKNSALDSSTNSTSAGSKNSVVDGSQNSVSDGSKNNAAGAAAVAALLTQLIYDCYETCVMGGTESTAPVFRTLQSHTTDRGVAGLVRDGVTFNWDPKMGPADRSHDVDGTGSHPAVAEESIAGSEGYAARVDAILSLLVPPPAPPSDPKGGRMGAGKKGVLPPFLPPAVALAVECLAVRSKVQFAVRGHAATFMKLIFAKGLPRAWQILRVMKMAEVLGQGAGFHEMAEELADLAKRHQGEVMTIVIREGIPPAVRLLDRAAGVTREGKEEAALALGHLCPLPEAMEASQVAGLVEASIAVALHERRAVRHLTAMLDPVRVATDNTPALIALFAIARHEGMAECVAAANAAAVLTQLLTLHCPVAHALHAHKVAEKELAGSLLRVCACDPAMKRAVLMPRELVAGTNRHSGLLPRDVASNTNHQKKMAPGWAVDGKRRHAGREGELVPRDAGHISDAGHSSIVRTLGLLMGQWDGAMCPGAATRGHVAAALRNLGLYGRDPATWQVS